MEQQFKAIIKFIIGDETIDESLANICIPAQFRPEEEDIPAVARNLNAAFLISLSGDFNPLYNEASRYLSRYESHPAWGRCVSFYKEGLQLIGTEISHVCSYDETFHEDLNHLYTWIQGPDSSKNMQETVDMIRTVFFPEGVSLCKNRNDRVNELRKKRNITVTKLNPSPVRDPAREILMTSNILITTPLASQGIDELHISGSLKKMLKQIVQEEQVYWYDHPIPVGITPEHNEVLYGLEGLDRAVVYEKQRGTLDEDARVTCALSVSATHKGLQGMVKEYLEEEFRKEKNIQHLDVYIFTETDTIKLIEEILVPLAGKYLHTRGTSILYEIIGVDGEYGRHYSFLKAIAAFWQVFIKSEIKGVFKIDLDQVFPQHELVEQGGTSAFEHFKTPLWGAQGNDDEGNAVDLGMIAGALVNQKDIGKSLFTPDVCFPPDRIKADELIFFSSLPQAVSTEAEMMTRYTDAVLDGKKRCIQRIHVTGGTCGILVDTLRKYRPFTPTFIGRAEDQAYILSVLFDGTEKKLRYVHKDGLIMRHDKEAFAGEAIRMAATGKLIGDYIRILMFSYYVKALPWSTEEVKNTIDPFTGCFVSKIPLTIVYLRFALKAATFFKDDTGQKNQQGIAFIQNGVNRMHQTIQNLVKEPNPLVEQFRKERMGWNLFYEILDIAESEIGRGVPFVLEVKERATALIKGCKINFRGN